MVNSNGHMITICRPSGDDGRFRGDLLAARHGLRAVAELVFGGICDDEQALRAVVRTGQALAGETASAADLAFFLVAWGADRIAALRIAEGDLGIDDIARRAAALHPGSAAWRQAMADYDALAAEIFVDTLNEFREFALVVAFTGRREAFLRRWSAGQRQLATLSAESAAGYPGLTDLSPENWIPGYAA